jgi:hypothetical protein
MDGGERRRLERGGIGTEKMVGIWPCWARLSLVVFDMRLWRSGVPWQPQVYAPQTRGAF